MKITKPFLIAVLALNACNPKTAKPIINKAINHTAIQDSLKIKQDMFEFDKKALQRDSILQIREIKTFNNYLLTLKELRKKGITQDSVENYILNPANRNSQVRLSNPAKYKDSIRRLLDKARLGFLETTIIKFVRENPDAKFEDLPIN
jgi:hypothetical protein